MNFLIDENFPKLARQIIENFGYEILDSRELINEGAEDWRILEIACEKNAVVLTTDRDFFHTLGRQNHQHHGILVIALKKPTREKLLKRLEWFLNQFEASEIYGRTFQLRDRAWMVYPPL